MNEPLVSCSCCGEALPDERRIDVRFNLPDAALTAPREALHCPGPDALLRVDGAGSFVRCLLPVRLSHETELVLGAWLAVDDAVFQHLHAVWDDPAYAEVELRGTIANAIKPWGEELRGARVTARVADPEELPYLVAGHDPTAARVLEETWDRDLVLSRFPHQLPVAVRTDLGAHWSVERTAGLTARYADGADQFAGPGRSVAVTVFEDDAPGRTPEDFLAALLDGAPDTLPGQRLTERLPGGVRYAFWRTPADHGGERHEFYGFMAPTGSTAAGVFCTHESADDLAWAQGVWRSLRWDGGTDTP
ncbi:MULTISPECIES: DUF2199 domain-containing protein [unclassified Streptomyces]|uniref:DUF2199 domain-containing protein n=1 Tax=unclassified Streptomyces TaxID=2593676 RepID=UPI0033B6FE1A